jgi:hypothetical protein
MSYDFLFLAFDLSGVALRARRDWLIARRLLVLDWPAWLAGWLCRCAWWWHGRAGRASLDKKVPYSEIFIRT